MKIGIIGAGASGMMAAITAAKNGAKVTLFEKNDRVGRKILVTGNGKCNLSNLEFDMSKYYCADKDKLSRIFKQYSLDDVITFFEESGMMIRSKNGYLYPYSEQASTVLDVLRTNLEKEKIIVITECDITRARYNKEIKKFEVAGNVKNWQFDRLIIACGGPAAQKKNEGISGFRLAEGFGHSIKKLVPGLVQLRAYDKNFFKMVSGVRFQARATLMIEGNRICEEMGEVQFTDYGLSGIPIFQFSREAAYALDEGKKVSVLINLFPDKTKKELEKQIYMRYNACLQDTLEEFLLGTVNKKLNQAMMKAAGLKPSDKISELGFTKVLKFLMSYSEINIHIAAVNDMQNAQVCAGGVDFAQISTELESLKCPGLYFAGEVIDVDGKCGGYNLQWAWTSGYLAGKNAAEASREN